MEGQVQSSLETEKSFHKVSGTYKDPVKSTEKEARTNKKRRQPPITDFLSKKYINKKWIYVKNGVEK